MAKRIVIENENGFTRLPEGEQILKVTGVEEKLGGDNLEVTICNQSGVSHTETYRFITKEGNNNNVALQIYTNMAARILGIKVGEEFEDQELLGMFFKATIEWVDGKPYVSTKTGKEVTPKKLRLTNIETAYGFDSDEDDDDIDLSMLEDLD